MRYGHLCKLVFNCECVEDFNFFNFLINQSAIMETSEKIVKYREDRHFMHLNFRNLKCLNRINV